MADGDKDTAGVALDPVRRFHADLFEEVRGFKKVSWRQLEKLTQRGNATLRGWQNSKRLITEDKLELLLEAGKLSDERRQDYRRRHAALRNIPAPETRDTSRTLRAFVFGAAAGALVGASAAVILMLALTAGEPTPSAGQVGSAAVPPTPSGLAPGQADVAEPCGALPVDLRPGAVVTHVGDTGGRGLTMQGLPRKSSCEAGALKEQDEVRVVCLALDGDRVTDEFGGQERSSTAWAKLTSGAYVSSLYLELPFTDGAAPVAGLTAC